MSESEKMKALVQLAGAISHELNNIFTAVSGNLSLVREHIQQGSMPAEMLGEVVQTAQRGIELSAKLQAFAGRQPLKRKRIDINDTLVQAVNDLRDSLPSTVGVTLALAPKSCVSFIDEGKLHEVVQELAKNAVTAMNDKGVLCIDVTRKIVTAKDNVNLRPGAYAHVRVIDNGPGMAPDVVRRAMDPMFSTKQTHVDIGWGLSNCAGFIRQSGGTMSLVSEIGSGTSVELYLPVEMPAVSDAPPTGSHRPSDYPVGSPD
jgi:signal transduction histidine kinase